ncbi:7607_t:CDS:10 [Ambispora gerdemannii]|uniref:RNA helicase n=1 Tax=Ambispora gerdemannii TaxID=144530 RepID=A0A9N8V5B9_9GLOM|nr:7607_t:CDS:10 [Ambispora gerdemannii]
MARHSRSRSRSRSSYKKRKHSHRSERARSRERSSSTKESVSERARESRDERRGRDKDRHREEREHKRAKHSRVDFEREDASESTSDRHSHHHHHHNGRSSTATITTISNIQETHEIRGSNKSSSHIITFNGTDSKTENISAIGVRDTMLSPTTVSLNGHVERKKLKSQSPEPKVLDVTSPKTIVSVIDQEEEEKIRQRRERVEQWRREREVAKKAEEAAKAKIAAESSDLQDVNNNGKGWSLDDDDEDDVMEIDGVTETVVDLPLPIPKVADKSAEPPSPLQFRRNPLLGLGSKKSTVNIKAKLKATPSTEDEDKGLISSSPSKLNSAKEAAVSSSTNIMQIDEIANEDEDPLDAYMKDVEIKVGILNEQDKKIAKQIDKAKKLKKKDLAAVDHSQVKYEPFQKNFYIEPPEMRDLTPDQVDLLRGIDCPKPIKKWTHAGLPASCLQVIKKLNFEKPTPIQSQAIPAIMAGRDVIGVAKTGSGKTIAFLLPMFRHIKDQRPLEPMEGPISIIMTPTRELAVQIHKEYQIADLKRGAEIIVCTPGRMIDLLCANAGRVTNLKRVTYMVLDEADRMFDMGFEPQVMKIVNNVRPDRQTVLFSATFPRQMESLARKVLRKPLEITVGGRSVVAQDVTQLVEVREENTKFVRLLEIMGQQYNDDPDARCLIFVDRQEAADNLLRDLIRKGYPCMSLHGGKDQLDRDSTIADFKSGVCQLLIATSVAARGLDVKQLKLVINYECPNHMEDYVHRVGRTGRAGNKGTAYTFITPEQDRYAMDIMKALKLSGGNVTPELQQLAEGFQEKVKAGSATYSGSGFGGKGLERLDEARDLVKKAQRKTYGDADDETSEDEVDEDEETSTQLKKEEVSSVAVAAVNSKLSTLAASNSAAAASSIASVAPSVSGQSAEMNPAAVAALKAAQQAAARINASVGTSGVQRAKDIIADINSRFKENSVQGGVVTEENKTENTAEYSVEIEINDYPQKARWKVTNKEQISQITELTGAAITTRGTYFPPGRNPAPGSSERKLYLFVEGENEYVVEKAKNEIKRILTETTLSAIEAESRNPGSNSLGGYGKYTVV